MQNTVFTVLILYLLAGCGEPVEQTEAPPAPKDALIFAVIGDYDRPGKAVFLSHQWPERGRPFFR
ncbi:MAG: hypothetical protein H6577_27670 [Lewinellaceae bacterium]|nr:hypothetical protein [Saprospiraceae bacterium]MCB9341924.1 hypothetical protein [Lewinellaceae bacterium]